MFNHLVNYYPKNKITQVKKKKKNMSRPTAPNTTLRLTRVFKAPRDRVYAAWTDPAQMKQWSGPEGVETIAWQLDARVGGKWRWDLRNADGEEMSAFGEYREIRPGEKLVYTWKWDDDPAWEKIDSLVTIEFRDHPDGTELRLIHDRLPSEQSRDNHMGGWTSALDKLERFLAR
jgi:uncharacterized protein YndB with AHSA1/START domain